MAEIAATLVNSATQLFLAAWRAPRRVRNLTISISAVLALGALVATVYPSKSENPKMSPLVACGNARSCTTVIAQARASEEPKSHMTYVSPYIDGKERLYPASGCAHHTGACILDSDANVSGNVAVGYSDGMVVQGPRNNVTKNIVVAPGVSARVEEKALQSDPKHQ